MSREVRATIHLAALRENLRRVRTLAPTARVIAVVKADGYGHGLERVAHALQGADAFGVASIADGQRLRAAGLAHRVIVLSGIDEPDDLFEMRRLHLDTVIHHESQVEWLERDRSETGKPLRVWFKLDTGMHRLGFSLESAPATLARLRACAAVDPQIVLMTHFANSDVADDPITRQQIARLRAFVGDASRSGVSAASSRSEVRAEESSSGRKELGIETSLANSAGVLGFPEAHAQWIRVGGLLYGVSAIAGRSGVEDGFEPAMTLSTKLIAINDVKRGERIGYGGAWECPEDMRVGVAAIGYGDGYPRHAANGTPALLRGRVAGVIGRVSMDLVTIDLRQHPDAQVGDRVVLWGRGLPVETVAGCANTIGYELICGMTRRVTFVEDDQLPS